MGLDPVVRLWDAGAVPGRTGLYRVGGPARALSIGGAALSRFELGEDLAEVDDEIGVDIHPDADVPIPGGFLVGGEGALGHEGFFARLDQDRRPVWVVTLEDGNPIIAIEVTDRRARFTNNLGNTVTVDLDSPEFGP
ncbi:hypothetical protein [Actinokineospora globicatena]|uniref:Uncharacterized protein n=1 Tax=Actinokineospora globicatena TaxID=103729 RepID=A0A9W6V7X0_9PSEU|nr:hypothetical protein [Actinokineospora globicatena]GLW89376.1 hypothetical protein Aglo03_01920 [Actinokineospora globicatena]